MSSKSIKGTRTEQNLLKSFAGESQARNRYTYFASVARDEGYRQIEAIFQETADQEKEHAKRFFKFLEGGELEILSLIHISLDIIIQIIIIDVSNRQEALPHT